MATDNDEDFTFGEFISTQSPQIHSTHQKSDPYLNRIDPGPKVFGIQKGALPLSLFGEVEDEIDVGEVKSFDLHHDINVNFNNNANFGKFNGGFDPNLGSQNRKVVGNDERIMYVNGSGLGLNNHDGIGDDDEDYGEWEFRDALSGNMQDHRNSSVVDAAKVESVVNIPLEGQDASSSVEHKPDFSSFSLQTNDLFAGFPRAVNRSNEKDDGFKTTSGLTNGFVWDAFRGAEDISNKSVAAVTANNSTKKEFSSSSSLPQLNDIFAFSLGTINRSSEIDGGHTSTSGTTNGFTWDAFSGVEKIANGSEISGTNLISVEHKPRSISFFPPSDDLFATPLKDVHESSEIDVEFKPTNVTINSFRFDAFPEIEKNGITSSGSAEHKHDTSSFLVPSDNLFVVPEGAVVKSSENFGEFKKTSVTTNGFMFEAFPEVASVSYGNGLSAAAAAITKDDDLDDFGDFIDASQEVRMGKKEEIFPHMTVASEAQLRNEKTEVPRTLLVNSKEALPLSLFGDVTEETSDNLNHSDEFANKRTSNPGISFSGQDSGVSIHDLISNLYSQAQTIQSVNSDGKPSETEVHISQEKESPSLVEDDEWGDDSWEFKGASRESGVSEKPSSDSPGSFAQIQLEISHNFQNYIDFYMELRESLCFLLSCQVDELQKAQCSDTGTGFTKITETLNNEIEKIQKLLEQNVVSQVVSEKHLEKSSCLNEVCKILEGSNYNMIESEYSLSKKLQLAVNDWKVAVDVLRHAISILKCLSIGSLDEQFRYASTWSNVIDVCAQELRHGALIWTQASEKKVQHQILSDCRGQKHIQALGETYKVVELLGLSTRVYKAWLVCSVSDSSRFMGLLNECRALWSSSGLEEALQKLSDDIDFGGYETAQALLASINRIRDFDVLDVHDCVFDQPKSICRLSLLPREMLPDLKTVTWNEEHYFLGLANLWANLISSEPPQLPHVQVR